MSISKFVRSFKRGCWWSLITLLRVDFIRFDADMGYSSIATVISVVSLISYIPLIKLLSLLISVHGLVVTGYVYSLMLIVSLCCFSKSDNKKYQYGSTSLQSALVLHDALFRFLNRFRPWFISARSYACYALEKFGSLRHGRYYQSPFMLQYELVLYYVVANQPIFLLFDKACECFELLTMGYVIYKGVTLAQAIVIFLLLKVISTACMRSLERFIDDTVFSCGSSRADKKKMAYRVVLNLLASVSTRLRLASSRYIPSIVNPHLDIAHKILRICKLGGINAHLLPYLKLDGHNRFLEMGSYFKFTQFYLELNGVSKISNVTRYLFQEHMGCFKRLFLFIDDRIDYLLHPVWTILLYATMAFDVTMREIIRVKKGVDPVVPKVLSKMVKSRYPSADVVHRPKESIIATSSTTSRSVARM